jgi:DNA polymerase
MSEHLPENLQQKLCERLRYYEDIGISLFYRDRSAPTRERADTSTIPVAESQKKETPLRKTGFDYDPRKLATAAPRKAEILPVPSGPSLFEAVNRVVDDSLLKIRTDLGECTRCKLHKGRNKIVFGDGNPKAELVFVGEGPGADEDAQGLPFVGRAGKLLTQMIEAMGLRRKDVYICNVVKCRPPDNRAPE